MKRTLATILSAVLWTCVSCSGQISTTPKQPEKQASTALETFMGKSGKLIVKDSYSLGSVKGRFGQIQIDALVIYEPNSTQKIKGLRVEVTESGRFERSNTSFIDIDELESLSQGIAYMSGVAAKWSGESHEPYTELIYKSKGDLQVGFYQKGTDKSAFCKSGAIGAATAFLEVSSLSDLKNLVDQAIVLLKAK